MTPPCPPLTPSVTACQEDAAQWAAVFMASRQTVLPKRLVAPGPTPAELDLVFQAAATAPDHGQLLPWRFVGVPVAARASLGDTFVAALRERDPESRPEHWALAREKAFRSPCLLLLVVDAVKGDPDVGMNERLLSAGCALQNALLMSTALGYGSSLTSGKALQSQALRAFFALAEHEHAQCFVNIGTTSEVRAVRQRPSPSEFVSTLRTFVSQANPEIHP